MKTESLDDTHGCLKLPAIAAWFDIFSYFMWSLIVSGARRNQHSPVHPANSPLSLDAVTTFSDCFLLLSTHRLLASRPLLAVKAKFNVQFQSFSMGV